MKKINTLTMMILLTFSFSIAQELEVEGDLTVTGTIESVTIDSLEQVIANIQAEIVELQAGGGWETRMFQYDFTNTSGSSFYPIDIFDICGYNLELASVSIINKENITSFEGLSGEIWILNSMFEEEYAVPPDAPTPPTYGGYIRININNNYDSFHQNQGPILIVPNNTDLEFQIGYSSAFVETMRITFLITAQFTD